MLEGRHKTFRIKYIIPNSITYMNMFLGLGAIFISILGGQDNFNIASKLILIAAITDKLDGYVARRIKSTSEFGKELDSLCDLVSFGLAPIILWWSMNIGNLGVVEILSSVFFVAAGVFRLARFNITRDDGYIRGLPITLAGMMVALKYILDIGFRHGYISNRILNQENSIILIILSFMMISTFKLKKPL